MHMGFFHLQKGNKKKLRKNKRKQQTIKNTPWLLVHKQTIPADRPPQPPKLVVTYVDRRCCVVNAMDAYSR
jgi:hypothetical protein